ncbi:hypothetical protein [Oceanobacillus jeddahense]|uniref:Uncharacterized protein n=1 Tax=Oceanobacillus jeddahense TaxID=1462527 RepID=A0ABY5JZ95_9BACI|nr:hypothetical protein [Oceanobacillus jeddahense]UUI04376.1 hypothetical protein NP439_06905 [Oceanobacillus jeddahense]
MKLIKNKERIIRKQDELHDIAEESTNGVFAGTPKETEKERKKNHSLADDFITEKRP